MWGGRSSLVAGAPVVVGAGISCPFPLASLVGDPATVGDADDAGTFPTLSGMDHARPPLAPFLSPVIGALVDAVVVLADVAAALLSAAAAIDLVADVGER